MSKLFLITPPDKIFTQGNSSLLIHPSEDIKEQAQQILANSDKHQNVHLYNLDDDNADVDWLLSVCNACDVVVLDYDNSPSHIKTLAAYLVSIPTVYWLASEDKMLYNKISPNRIYGLDSIEDLIGGNFEG